MGTSETDAHEGIEDVLDSLRIHAHTAAERARKKLSGALSANTLSAYLNDKDCLRYPTRIVFDREGLGDHQFAEPEFIKAEPERHCVLHIDPVFENAPDDVPFLVAYMAACINYGAVVTPELCERHGAILVDKTPDDFYEIICALADRIGSTS